MTDLPRRELNWVRLGQCVIKVQFGARNNFLGPSENGGRAPKGLIMSQGPTWLETGARQGSKEQGLEFYILN